MSTGASNLAEIEEAVNVLRKNGCKNITLLKCTSTYPATPQDSNILTIPHLKQLFDCEVGLSDHTLGVGVAVASIALGANVIEKHFCLDRSEGGVDSAFSLEPAEFKLLVEECKRAYLAKGKITYGIIESEEKVSAGKRSIYASNDIKAGDKFTRDNVKVVRPGFGLHPRYFEQLLAKTATRDLPKGTPLSLIDINA
jgi:N-acetylneuraminate synthase